MLSNRLALAALATACVAAAGVGGYVASRQSTTTLAGETSPRATSTSSAPQVASGAAVQETEAVVGGPSSPVASTAPVPASVASSVAVRRAEPAARTTPEPRAATPASAGRTNAPHASSDVDRSTSQPAAAPAPATAATTISQPADAAVQAARPEERPAPAEASVPPGPPAPTFDELIVPADSVIGLQTETSISSERARVEDRVEARVTRDVRTGSKVAIPAGSRAIGSVTLVERGGKFKERARLGVRFHTLVLADGTRTPISTDTIYREGEDPGNGSAAKIGGAAVGGAILGAILGGAKGAAIGATAGAGAGTAATAASDRSAATLLAGQPLTVRILAPVTITVEEK